MPWAAKGHVERLPSGSFRVSVYAGVDPLTRQEIRLRSTVNGELQAQIVLGRLLKEAPEGRTPEGRTPESDATMDGLMDQYAAIAEWDVSTRQTNEGFIRRTISPSRLDPSGFQDRIGPVTSRDLDLGRCRPGRPY